MNKIWDFQIFKIFRVRAFLQIGPKFRELQGGGAFELAKFRAKMKSGSAPKNLKIFGFWGELQGGGLRAREISTKMKWGSAPKNLKMLDFGVKISRKKLHEKK